MNPARFTLTIQDQKPIQVFTLDQCFPILNFEYSKCADWYADELYWKIEDHLYNRQFECFMAGGIWEACCEEVSSFIMYLNICWEEL